MLTHHQPTWLERIYIPEVLRGLSVTVRHFTRNLSLHIAHTVGLKKDVAAAVTIPYPDVPADLMPRFRGMHRLTRKADDSIACTACLCCETACPCHAIDIVPEAVDDSAIEKRPRSFEINLAKCSFCGFCVEACPVDAIRMDTGIYDLTVDAPRELVWGKEALLANPKGAGMEVYPPIDRADLAPRACSNPA